MYLELCKKNLSGEFVYIVLYLTDWLTNSMEHSCSWETNRSSASQEIPHILWDLKVHYRIHEQLLPVPIPNQGNPVHASPSHFFNL